MKIILSLLFVIVMTTASYAGPFINNGPAGPAGPAGEKGETGPAGDTGSVGDTVTYLAVTDTLDVALMQHSEGIRVTSDLTIEGMSLYTESLVSPDINNGEGTLTLYSGSGVYFGDGLNSVSTSGAGTQITSDSLTTIFGGIGIDIDGNGYGIIANDTIQAANITSDASGVLTIRSSATFNNYIQVADYGTTFKGQFAELRAEDNSTILTFGNGGEVKITADTIVGVNLMNIHGDSGVNITGNGYGIALNDAVLISDTLDMTNDRITNVATPVNNNDAVNKLYVTDITWDTYSIDTTIVSLSSTSIVTIDTFTFNAPYTGLYQISVGNLTMIYNENRLCNFYFTIDNDTFAEEAIRLASAALDTRWIMKSAMNIKQLSAGSHTIRLSLSSESATQVDIKERAYVVRRLQ